ncbi:hypothetical protein EJB05_15399 [Eragrostis curvula]|uniref:ENT domain-containing protein n=1 Tax=Eragrostis curvula TaxID=38414 RepID=A0A5J9W2W5_9POAL|nr:hypothetical protein EJB05_15399 [Eragrostis curvula]
MTEKRKKHESKNGKKQPIYRASQHTVFSYGWLRNQGLRLLPRYRIQPSHPAELFSDNHQHLGTEVNSKIKKMMQREDVKPHRPVDMRKSRWILGDIVDVFYQNLWRPGKIIKVLKNDYFLIRLTCCIQLKELHISCLRLPQTNHGNRSTVIDKDGQGFEEDGHRTKRHKSSKICPSAATRLVKKKLKARRTLPDDFIRVTGNKTKAAAYEVHQKTKKLFPLKVSATNGISDDHLHRPFSNKHNDLARNSFMKTKLECEVLSPPQIQSHAREENECSVASCSANCLECSITGDQQSVELGSCFPDDAMSTCLTRSWRDNNNVYGTSLDMNLHDLELHAYQSTIRALYVLGPLTWEQESLLTNLRLSLNISNEEHLLQEFGFW